MKIENIDRAVFLRERLRNVRACVKAFRAALKTINSTKEISQVSLDVLLMGGRDRITLTSPDKLIKTPTLYPFVYKMLEELENEEQVILKEISNL